MITMVGKINSNPRYVAYSKAHSKTPDEMMEHDRVVWPGGHMCGFIVWMSEQKKAFWKMRPLAFLNRHMIHDQDAWTAFLRSIANAPAHIERKDGVYE